LNSILAALTIWALLGQQRTPDAAQVIRPKLTLIEQEDAKRRQVDVWIVDEFVFIPPRMITVEVPGKGRQLLWYLVYRVTNRGDKSRPFVPNFTLVDDKGKAYRDSIIPKAQRAIQDKENPLQPLENSVTVIGDLPPSTDEGVDHSVYGVAIWEAVDPKLNAFDILITGLSNGFKTLDDPAKEQKKVQRKTLVLRFARPGDEFYQNAREVRYLGQEWIYQ
jgi:hypothetical protein